MSGDAGEAFGGLRPPRIGAGLPAVDHRDPSTLSAALASGAAAVAAEHPLPALLVLLRQA